MIRNNPLALAHVVEKDGVLTITQSNGPALRNLQNISRSLMGSAVCFLFWYLLFPQIVNPWCRVVLTGSNVGVITIFGILFVSFALFHAVNRFFGRETFVFDTSEDVFIRNGFRVGPLSDIRAVTAQVTSNDGQTPMFRLILELPRCETVTIVRTHEVVAEGEFHLSGDGFSDPNKKFAVCTPWLNYEEQRLVPFLPQEITDLRRKILESVGEARPAPHP